MRIKPRLTLPPRPPHDRLAGLVLLVATLCLVVGGVGCASSRKGSTEPTLPPATSFLRTSSIPGGGRELQIAIRRYAPTNRPGPQIWLVGVSHVGDATYYQALQKLLDLQSTVLFEGVRPSPAPPPLTRSSRTPQPTPWRPDHEALNNSLQGTLARSLGLVFQLTAIDYTRPHFRNSDLTRVDLEQLIQQNSESIRSPGSPKEPDDEASAGQFALLMQALDEGSWLNAVAKFFLNFIESSPQMRSLARLALLEMLGAIGGDFESLARVDPSLNDLLKVLVDARNQRVLDDLRALLPDHSRRRQIAVFYGAAHMKDFEARLAAQLGYLPREERWLTAFGVDFQQSGIGTSEQRMIRSLVDWQLQSLRPPAP